MTSKQLEWLNKQGGRTMSDDKGKNLGEKELSLADKIQKRVEEVAEAAVVIKTLGIRPDSLEGNAKEKDGADNLPATLLTGALDAYKDAAKRAQETLDKKEADLKAARDSEDVAKAAYYQVQVDAVKETQARIEKALDELKKGGEPRDAVSILKEADDLIQHVNKMRPQPSTESKGTVVISEETQIRLEEMRQAHDIEMKKLDIQISQMNQDFQIRLAEFQDNRTAKMREYDDRKDFRNRGLEGFEDLAHSMAQGLTREREGSVSTKGRKSVAEETVQAAVRQFSCQFCGTKIPVKSDSESVTCPNDECGAQYEVKLRTE